MPRPRRACRIAAPAAIALAAVWLAAVGCAGASGEAPHLVHDFTMRERVARVQAGQTLEEAHAILGDAPVRKPGHPDDPFPTPHRALELVAATGEPVRVEIYVVAARTAEGCPDVHWDDEPVAYLDGVVAGKGWVFVERRWRGWGGSLEALREVQNRHRCPVPKSDP